MIHPPEATKPKLVTALHGCARKPSEMRSQSDAPSPDLRRLLRTCTANH